MITKIKDNIILCSILVGAIIVRICGIGKYYFNGDEMQNLIIARGATIAEVCRRRLIELHPPLVDILHHYLELVTVDMFALRLFSVLTGMIAVVGFYKLGNQLQGRALGLFCAFCNAFAPIAVITSITYRNYPLFMAFMVWGLYYFFRYLETYKQRHLGWFIFFIWLTCASHFSGFLVAAICGITGAFVLLKNKDWKNLATFTVSFLPLGMLAAVFYGFYYAGPDATAPRWKDMGVAAGLVQQGVNDKLVYTFFGIFIYFFPIISFVNGDWFEVGGLFRDALVAGGALSVGLYVMGMKTLYAQNRKLFWLIIVAWGIAICTSLSNVYPISITRHNYYFEPFFILPFGFLFVRYLTNLRSSSSCKNSFASTVFLVAIIMGTSQSYVKNESELSLTKTDYKAAQEYLKSHVSNGDTIVAGHEGAYLYLLYNKDRGETSYDSYSDFSVFKDNNVFTNSPFNATDRQSFHKVLMAHTQTEGQTWFTMIAWKNAEIKRFWECKYTHDKVRNFFSRDGVLIFSLNASDVSAITNNANEWNACFPDVKPDLSATAFKKFTPVP